MQIKTTMRDHVTPVRMAVIHKSTNNECWQDVEKGNSGVLLMGMQIGAATVESSMELSQKN